MFWPLSFSIIALLSRQSNSSLFLFRFSKRKSFFLFLSGISLKISESSEIKFAPAVTYISS